MTIKPKENNQLVVSGSGDKTLRLWDVASGKCVKTLEGHSDYVSSVSFSKDNKIVVSGSGDNTLRLWDVATGKCVKTLEGHSDYVRSVCFS
jgi:WD40 repeat protein